jgi:hypothetical protein
VWKQSFLALYASGYSRENLLDFIDQGPEDLPNNSILIKQKKGFASGTLKDKNYKK